MKNIFDKFCMEINFKKTKSFNNVKIIKTKLINDNLFEINFISNKIIPFIEMEQFLDNLFNNFKYKVKLNFDVVLPVYDPSEVKKYLNWIIKNYLKNDYLSNIVYKSITNIESSGIINLTFANDFLINKFLDLKKEILKIFISFGFQDLVFNIKIDKNQNILQNEKAKILKEAQDFKIEKKNNFIPTSKKGFIKKLKIKDLYNSIHNKVNVLGKVFHKSKRETKKNMIIFNFTITDYTEAIYVKFFLTKKSIINQYDDIKINDYISVYGVLQLDAYTKQQTIVASFIDKINDIVDKRYDNFINKRVELSFRTKMSTMDGILTPKEIVTEAIKWGHNAVAIIDFESVQSFPDFYFATKNTNVKAIYGTTINLIDKNSKAIFNNHNKNLSNDEYVVFDLETTGLSPEFNELIEFGAIILKNDRIIDSIQFFINPKKKIPEKITKFTKITNENVKNAISEKDAMKKIINFIGNKTLVAHNAIFDYTFLCVKSKKYNLKKINNPIIDTLITSRIIHTYSKIFKLEKIAKKYDIFYDVDIAHRADYDSKILAHIFIKQLKELEKLGISNQKLLYEYSSEGLYEKTFKYTMTILAKNQQGLKELFSIMSKSLTKNFYKNANVFIEDFKNTSNLLLGSGGLRSKLVNLIFTGSKDQIKKEIIKYDYIEIQPPQNFKHKINETFTWQNLFEIIKFIIKEAKKQNKIVVATGDVRYLNLNEKIYHEVYINAKGLGGIRHYLFNYDDDTNIYPDQHFLTTSEMINQFDFLDDEKLIHEIVVDNTNLIANSISEIKIIKKELYTPKMKDVDAKLETLVYKEAKKKYGDILPKIVEDRIKKEIKPIKKYGFSVIYWISHLLVSKSLRDGYLVGSRGSVGSSFVATMANITEVNPLIPHHLCINCKKSEFYIDTNLNSGYDLEDKNCPKCNNLMSKEGQNIPFETFLGFEANKVPDIDLNFSGDYQKIIHNEVKSIFGNNYSFRAGTISTVAKKTAFGYVKTWSEGVNKDISKAYIEFLSLKIAGTKRTTGQHPGGIIVIPKNMSIEDFSPINYPANDKKSSWKTTHFDFHAIHDNVLKLDLLGHDDPTVIRHLEKLTGVDVKKDISFYDKKIISLFSSTKELNIKPEDIDGEKTGVMGIPEFGTKFVRRMLKNAKVLSFGDLISISGLSHGTDVWADNAELVIKEQGKKLSEVISCRDNIMIDLIAKGINASLSFQVMEQARKGNGITSAQERILKEKNVENWYIESLKKIKYIFPKSHAVAYVMMAWRIAWFKLYYPKEYYVTFFTTRVDVFDVETVIKGKNETLKVLQNLKSRKNNRGEEILSNKEIALIPILELVIEAFARKIKIGNISLKKSKIKNWIIDECGILIPPFVAIDGLGESVAMSIIKARDEKSFISIEDLISRTSLNKTTIDKFRKLGILDSLSEKNQMSIFSFLV